jgi:TfoX/Sxy family transcriptional regulator of competence genes
MAYDETLADRVRAAFAARGVVVREQKMFGGIAFMVRGNMCAGVIREDLMVRLGEEGADAALDEPHTRPMDFTGRPMRNMAYVGPGGTRSDADLGAWIDRCLAFNATLPAK